MCVHCIVFYSSATEALINNNNNNNNNIGLVLGLIILGTLSRHHCARSITPCFNRSVGRYHNHSVFISKQVAYFLISEF